MPNPHAIDLVSYSNNPTVTGLDFRQTIDRFIDSLKEAKRGEADQAVGILAPGLASPNLSRASHIAKICNSMVRSQCPWDSLTAPMHKGLARCLKKAAPILTALEKKIPNFDLEEDWDFLDDRAKEFQRAKKKCLAAFSERDRVAGGAWIALERFSHLALTILSLDKEVRSNVKKTLEKPIRRFAPWLPCLKEVADIFQILEEEPLLVIDVDNHKGFIGKFGGTVCNAQLFILIMDTLPNLEVFPKEFVARDLVHSANGKGPMKTGKEFQGLWNHYTYKALKSNGKLPDPKDLTANKHWVWMETSPTSIPTFEGYRVVLLGPPSYERKWGFERKHELVSAGIDVESELTRGDYDYWMNKILNHNIAHPVT